MFRLFFISLTLYMNCLYAEDFSLNINHSQKFYKNLAKPIWKDIKRKYDLKSSSFIEKSSKKKSQMSGKISSAKIDLGPKNYPLIKSVTPLDNNKFSFKWDFNKLTSKIDFYIKFEFNMYGYDITHEENFVVDARKISNASTLLQLNYTAESLKLKLKKNESFKFKNITIQPKNGIGTVLRFIFDNVWSKEEVDEYITEKINKRLRIWANNKKLLKDLQSNLNDELVNLETKLFPVPQIASNLNVDIKNIQSNTESINLLTDINFDQSNLSVHPCANNLVNKNYSKNDLNISHTFLETIINNLATYEVINQNSIQEPIFCFGHKRYDINGNPEGSLSQFKFFGRNIKSRYSIKPISLPTFNYDESDQSISMINEFEVKLVSNSYPKIYSKSESVMIKTHANFKVEFLKEKGITLGLNNFKIQKIVGKIYLKWGKYFPKIKVSKKWAKKRLSKLIKNEIETKLHQYILIDENTDIGTLRLKIKDYTLHNDFHSLSFQLK